jgi:hypothetical protein
MYYYFFCRHSVNTFRYTEQMHMCSQRFFQSMKRICSYNPKCRNILALFQQNHSNRSEEVLHRSWTEGNTVLYTQNKFYTHVKERFLISVNMWQLDWRKCKCSIVTMLYLLTQKKALLSQEMRVRRRNGNAIYSKGISQRKGWFLLLEFWSL